jgi:hypothetical protein
LMAVVVAVRMGFPEDVIARKLSPASNMGATTHDNPNGVGPVTSSRETCTLFARCV